MKRKTSVPSDGYICFICKEPGHWIQQCPMKNKRQKKKKTHLYKPGVDPSKEDIHKARQLQKIKPPNCFCGIVSRLKKVKRTKTGEDSRAIGKYFFFCSKGKFDDSKCRFARPVEDEVKPKKERLCTFFAKTGVCKKGQKCMFSHDVSVSASMERTDKREGVVSGLEMETTQKVPAEGEDGQDMLGTLDKPSSESKIGSSSSSSDDSNSSSSSGSSSNSSSNSDDSSEEDDQQF